MRIKTMAIGAVLAAGILLASGCSDDVKTSSSGGSASGAGAVTSMPPQDLDSRGNLDAVTLNAGDTIAIIEIEGYGTMKAKLYPDVAPLGVLNFTTLANEGFYDGKTIHRVIQDFMMQGGAGGKAAVNGGSFGIEPHGNMRHFYGALCYANASGLNSTQFYIVNNKGTFDDLLAKYELQRQNIQALYDEADAGDDGNAAALYGLYLLQIEQEIESVKAVPEEIKKLYNERGGVPTLDGSYTVFGQVYEGFNVIDAIAGIEVVDNGMNEKSKPVSDIVIKKVRISTYGE